LKIKLFENSNSSGPSNPKSNIVYKKNYTSAVLGKKQPLPKTLQKKKNYP